MGKPTVIIYVQNEAKSTQILTAFIGKHIDRINHYLTVRIIKVTAKNSRIVKANGIERTPTLVYNNRKFVTLEKIIALLTPPELNKDNYGYGNTSSDDLVQSYQDNIINAGDDDDDPADPDVRTKVIQQKMAALQKRRPEMNGVDTDRKLKGGRKVTSRPGGRKEFKDDEEFYKASRVDNIEDTPTKNYMDESDGALILEEYYNSEADAAGRKVGKKISRRR